MATGLQSAATPYDKPMDDEHRKILKESRQALAKDMEPEEVLLHMTDPHLFTDNDKDKIMANNLTRQQRNEILLDILPRKGAGAYEVFKKTIKKAHRPLFTILLEAENRVLASQLKIERQNTADLGRKLQISPGNQVCSRCQTLKNERDDVKKELDQHTTKTEDLKHKIEELGNQINKLQNKNEELEREKKKLENGKKELEKNYKRQEVELCVKRTDPFTPYHVLLIKDAVGQCWEDLGVALGIDWAQLQDLNHDYRESKERANKVLQIWMNKNGTNATVGCLASILIQIGHKRIADILLGM